MGVGILAKRVVLELSSSTNFVYSLSCPVIAGQLFYDFQLKIIGQGRFIPCPIYSNGSLRSRASNMPSLFYFSLEIR